MHRPDECSNCIGVPYLIKKNGEDNERADLGMHGYWFIVDRYPGRIQGSTAMTQMLEMPRVQTCTVTSCGYNHGGCNAFAITIGSANSAECDTFVDSADKGGNGKALAQVGAC